MRGLRALVDYAALGAYCADIGPSYRTQYTVLKREGGQTIEALPNLTPEPQGQVTWYHDIEIFPAALSTGIPCDS